MDKDLIIKVGTRQRCHRLGRLLVDMGIKGTLAKSDSNDLVGWAVWIKASPKRTDWVGGAYFFSKGVDEKYTILDWNMSPPSTSSNACEEWI